MPGGIPAPNLGYECPIKNVTGNANSKIQNKNLFDKNSLNIIQNRYLTITGGTGNNENFAISDYILVNGNTQYSLQPYRNLGSAICFYDENKNFISGIQLSQANPSLTTPIDCKYLRISFQKADKDIEQLEKGTSITSYVERQEQNYPFTFAEGQRGMQGTQLLDDGIHQKRKQITITETMIDKTIITSYSQLDYIRFGIPSGYVGRGKINSSLMSCANENKGWDFNDKKYIGTYTNRILYNYFYIGIPKGTTYDEIKDKIIGQILEYELAEEEIIPYNATQQAQYNSIKEASSYDDITIISSESDELGFNMNVVAVADANKLIDSLDTRLLALEENTNQSKSLNVSVDTKNITKETAEETAENAESSAESEEQ